MTQVAAGGAASSSSRGDRIARVGTILSAIMASSCCWLPPLLILAGVSGAGMTSALESYRPYFIVVTFGFLGTAFYLTYRPRHRAAAGTEDCCAAPTPTAPRRLNMMALNKVMLWAVTVVAVVFLFFPQYVMGLFAPSDQFTPGMERTVVQVIGMTCPG